MRLSKRLELVASFVEPESRVADVGTDHGFIPVELVGRGIALKAIAMDVSTAVLFRGPGSISIREGLRRRSRPGWETG